MAVDYDHARNPHTREGAQAGFSYVLRFAKPKSLLDVGAGTGSWLRAALDAGVADVAGVDGVETGGRTLEVDKDLIRFHDLRAPLDLKRKFDVAICFEVAEHLDESFAATVVASLCNHADTVFFSAAAPGQEGQHHVNCRWPDYWQALFNANGFVCDDDIRKAMWNDPAVEPWYRQNMFRAVKSPKGAGAEPRLLPLLHPDMTPCMDLRESPADRLNADIYAGRLKMADYVSLAFKAARVRLGGRR